MPGRQPSARRMLMAAVLAGCLPVLGVAAPAKPAGPARAPAPARTAAEVVARNAAARGGLEAWRKVQTLVWIGHTAPVGPDARPMPFVMQLRRPSSLRFEIHDESTQLTRIFDGTQGWKLRPGSDGRPDVKPFSPAETGYAREEFVIDGPLLDHDTKGVSVTLDGVDDLAGRNAYRLSLRLPSGAARNLWVDVNTNLEVRYDRPSGNPLQPGARVSTWYGDYGTVEGLRVPRRIEVGMAEGMAPPAKPDTLLIDKVLVNPPLSAQAFAPPVVPRQRGARVVVGGESPPGVPPPAGLPAPPATAPQGMP